MSLLTLPTLNITTPVSAYYLKQQYHCSLISLLSPFLSPIIISTRKMSIWAEMGCSPSVSVPGEVQALHFCH